MPSEALAVRSIEAGRVRPALLNLAVASGENLLGRMEVVEVPALVGNFIGGCVVRGPLDTLVRCTDTTLIVRAGPSQCAHAILFLGCTQRTCNENREAEQSGDHGTAIDKHVAFLRLRGIVRSAGRCAPLTV